MVAINFQTGFVPKILAGQKSQTIRRSQKAKAGDKLQLYTGQRTKACRKIADAVCTISYPLTIYPETVHFQGGQFHRLREAVHLDRFAQADGFESWEELVAFFEKQYGLPFSGWLIEWSQLKESKNA